MIDPGVLIDKLNGFETADDIAEFFKQQGIKATPRKATMCAISEWVKQESGAESVITTGAVEVWFGPQRYYDSDKRLLVIPSTYYADLSDVAVDFIGKFDSHMYPELEA